MSKLGTLYGVGVGPGDLELITVKAFRMLKEADVIAYPKKRKGSKSYAHQIVECYINPNEKEMLGLVFPMTKDQAILDEQWAKIADEVYGKLKEGKDVAFVTEGDPFLYSTYIHLMRMLQEKYEGIEMKVIPGISSVNGSAAQFGFPLADGDERIGIIPANDNREEMKEVLLNHDCVVFIKVAKVLPQMIDLLEELQLVDCATVATKVTSKEEVIFRDIRELKNAELPYLSLMVVKK